MVDREERRLTAVAERFSGVSTSTELADLLADDVDAGVVATPTSTHYEIAKAAIEAGKHVLVETPLTNSVETSIELCELARKAKRLLMVGHVFVFNSASRRVKQCIEAGDLGRIYYISMVRTNLGPIRVDVDAAWDLAAHDISMASYWLAADPLSVSARGVPGSTKTSRTRYSPLCAIRAKFSSTSTRPGSTPARCATSLSSETSRC